VSVASEREPGRRTPRSLTLLYDDSCPMCRTLRGFLAGRRPIVPLSLVAVGSPTAVAMFPDLDQVRAREVLTVIDDVGLLYEGDVAWLICAWALPGLHAVSGGASSGVRRTLFRSAVHAVDVVRQVGRSPRPAAAAPYPLGDGSPSSHPTDGSDAPDAPGTPDCKDSVCPVGFPEAIAINER
jgi:DCC1-like thiol-disulfide oxidoreductase